MGPPPSIANSGSLHTVAAASTSVSSDLHCAIYFRRGVVDKAHSALSSR